MNIHTYLERIRYQANDLQPSLRLLRDLHMAHLLTVPFENLNIHYGMPIILDQEKLFQKIVIEQRGGFCYELNGLFAWLLRELGFQVTLLSARVANDEGIFGPDFDHLTLLVHDLEGSDWLADVGFGESFKLPLRFVAEQVHEEENGAQYRLMREYDEHEREYWVMQEPRNDEWASQYRFTLKAQELIDFTEMCHYQQTSPESHFTQKRICSLATRHGRISLSDLKLITTINGTREERLLASEQEYKAVLAEIFGVVLI